MTATYLLTPGNLLWEILEKYGHDAEAVFVEHGVEKEMLHEEGRRISFDTINALWLRSAELITDPCFGLEAAGLWHPSYFGTLGYAWLASVTLRRALTRLERYIHVVSEETQVRLENAPDGLRLNLADAIQPPAYIDLTMAVIVRMCRLNCGEDFHPRYINIIHDQPGCSSKYYSLFRAPVNFSAETDSIVFSYDNLDTRLPSGNPHMAALTDQIMIDYLAALDRDDIVHRVKSAIIDHLNDGAVTGDRIAGELFMSVRNLHRSLEKAGTTFGRILDDTRREIAEPYVQDPSNDLTDIAFRLGYSEQSSFSRAFKRWTGMSPREFRAGRTGL